MSMTRRERVQAVLAGEEPDRTVVDLGGFVCSFSEEPYLALKAYMGFGDQLDRESITLIRTVGDLDERMLEAFDVPFRRITPKAASSFELNYEPDGSFWDEWGIHLKPMASYYERAGEPLKDATVEDLETYPWPDPSDPSRFEGLAEEARRFRLETDLSLVAGSIWSGAFQQCWYLRGMQRFFEDLLLHQDFAKALLDKVSTIYAQLWRAFLDAVGPYVDIVVTADDLAGQTGPLLSPETYRAVVKPAHARQFEAIREKTDARIFYHSDGALMKLIDDLIEIGVDILNPIQPLPGLMEPEVLRARYGNRLVFHGGVDVQSLLPKGEPGEVRAFVQRYYRILGAERYIMAPANTILPGTPPENIAAAFEAARDVTV
jgi:uroporphyrinogen decarboxylase